MRIMKPLCWLLVPVCATIAYAIVERLLTVGINVYTFLSARELLLDAAVVHLHLLVVALIVGLGALTASITVAR